MAIARSPKPAETRASVASACASDDYRAIRFTADVLPLLPFSRSNETFCFSLRLLSPARSTAEMCTKTSFELAAPNCQWEKTGSGAREGILRTDPKANSMSPI